MSTSSRIVRHTSEELRAKVASGTTGSDFERARRGEPDLTDPDAPDFGELLQGELRRMRGRPKGSGRKTALSLRIDRDVVDAYRATGGGWQTRMNDALRAGLNTNPKRARRRG